MSRRFSNALRPAASASNANDVSNSWRLRCIAFALCLAAGAARAEPLQVAVYDLPPYGGRAADGAFAGASVDLWRRVAEELGKDYEFTLVPKMETLIKGVEEGRFDAAIGAITITPERAAHVDFSYPAHRSGVAVALRKESGPGAALQSYGLAALELGSLILTMLALLFATGVAMWFIERPKGGIAQTTESAVVTLRDGIYWAVVTMTTVGYGDKTPKTTAGRFVAIVWMLGSLALVSLLSASLVSRLTAEQVESKAGFAQSDLVGKRLAAAASSSGAEFIAHLHLDRHDYPSLQEALAALEAGREDVVVNSVGALRHLVATRFSKTLRVPANLLAPAYMAIALPEHSPIKKAIDRALMRICADPEWRAIEESYFGR